MKTGTKIAFAGFILVGTLTSIGAYSLVKKETTAPAPQPTPTLNVADVEIACNRYGFAVPTADYTFNQITMTDYYAAIS